MQTNIIRVRLNWWSSKDTTVNLKIVLGIIVVGILFFFGIIFALALAEARTTSARAARLIVSVLLFGLGFVIIYVMTKRPRTIIQRLEMSGVMKSVPLKCPNCSASIDTNQIKIVSGVPYATCSYCGQTFQVTEEPKW